MDFSEVMICPDCKGDLMKIFILDATDRGMTGGIGHVEAAYAVPNTTASHFTGTIAKEGFIKGKICKECSRIHLFGSSGFESTRDEYDEEDDDE